MRPHLYASARAELAPAAAFERDARAKHYPAQVKKSEISAAEAQADWSAWVAIEQWLSGVGKPAWIEWPAMVATAEKALARRRAAVEAEPQNAGRIRRRDSVEAIWQMLRDHAGWLGSGKRRNEAAA